MNNLLKKYNELSEPVKASFWYTICNVINKGIALLSTPIFTRVMTESQYGTFAIFQSWYSIIIIFTSLNIFMSSYQKGLLLYKNDKASFTSTQLGLTTTITLFFILIYMFNPRLWSSIFELQPVLMFAMGLELLFMPALEFWSTKQRFDFKYKKYVAVSILMTIISLGGGVLAVLSTSHKVEARVYTDVLSKVLFSAFFFCLIFKRGKKFYSLEYWKYALAFNLPLIPHYLSNYVLSQSDRIMIGKMIGTDKAAFYSVAYTISMMMILIVNAINGSLVPYLYKKIDEFENDSNYNFASKNDVKKVTTSLILIIAALCFIAMLFAPEVIRIFAGNNYYESIYVVPPVALSVFFIFIYSLFSNVEYYFQETKLIALATFICALLNLVLNFIFIKIFGYMAAGYTTLVSYVALSILHYLFYKKILMDKKINVLYNDKLILLISIVLIVLMVIVAVSYKLTMIRYIMVVCIVLAIIYFRKNIVLAIKNLK